MLVNAVAASFIAVLVIGGYWIVSTLTESFGLIHRLGG
jgi:hypothetical protein